jgi:myo-inositol-1(or 4)-monophosphatase
MTVIERAARKAGGKLRRDFNEVQHLQVSRKGPADFVSKADIAAERTIYDELVKARPDWNFLFEEAGEIVNNPDKPRFIIDPLDGTTNFLHGIPHFAISIAVEEELTGGRREVTTALVYNPMTDESFWAEKGRGSWLQDQRLRVSSRRDMSDALIATGIPFLGHGDMGEWVRIFGAVAPNVAGIRRFGAAAPDLCYVAAGRVDAYFEEHLGPWDLAAGELIAREAGCISGDLSGGPVRPAQVLVSNPALFEPLRALINKADAVCAAEK